MLSRLLTRLPHPRLVTGRPMSTVAIPSEEAFTEHVSSNSKSKQLVYFTASWCGPCQVVAPTIEALSDQYAESVDILKVDVDNNPELSGQFEVTAVPMFVLLTRNGDALSEAGRVTGASIEQVEGLLK
eukprot:TRINITY_DN1707_c0_g1_i1.p1 TRINITY_DN1707_c0_g1~~TRINITY_DN1707_c0_g1_i1.p1  ORF type:complete len:128 (-),score=29.61 TRINITY_DN1707_c0_g1_i1:427-810(-)